MALKSNEFSGMFNLKDSTKGVLLVLSPTTLIASLAISSVNIVLPDLVVSLNSTFDRVLWVIISYMVFLSATLVVAGRLSDLFGQRKLFQIGIVVFTIAATIGGMAENLGLLVIVRAIQGVGAAILISVTLAIISDFFPQNRVGSAMGFIGSMSAIGTGLGPVLGGLIVEYLNWRAVFLINLPLGLVILLLAKTHLPGDSQALAKDSNTFDYPGALLLFLMILSYALTIKLTEKGLNIGLLGLSLICLVSFIVVERKTVAPLVSLSVLVDRILITSLLSNLIVSSVVVASLVIGPFFLTQALKLNTAEAGIVMAASPLTVAISSNLAGRVINQKNLRQIILFGLVSITAGALTMSMLKVSSGVPGYVFSLMIMAVGYATFLSANNTLTMSNAAPNIRGSISGLLNLSRNLGLLTGTAIMSNIYGAVSHINKFATANISLIEAGVNAVYQLAVVLLVLAIVVQLVVSRDGESSG